MYKKGEVNASEEKNEDKENYKVEMGPRKREMVRATREKKSRRLKKNEHTEKKGKVREMNG